MFASLASYLLGTSNEERSVDGVEETAVRLSTVETEGDWMLVNRDSAGNSDAEYSSEENSEDDDVNCNRLSSYPFTRSNSASSIPCMVMDDSWFVTPPPCFTCTEPVLMQTSPLENLLIEHPSMSVYQQTHPALVLHTLSARSLEIEDFLVDDVIIENDQVPVERLELDVNSPRGRSLEVSDSDRTNIRCVEEQQWLKYTKAQKVYLKKASTSLKNKYLERSNKAREVNYRNQHQQRSKRSRGAMNSYANNNRKC